MPRFTSKSRTLGYAALTALCLGTLPAALVALPLGHVALAKGADHDAKGGADHGGGKGKSEGHDTGKQKSNDKAAHDAKKAEKEAQEAAKKADKQAEEAAKKAEKETEEAAKKAEKQAEEAAKKAQEEAKKAAKLAEEAAKRAWQEPGLDSDDPSLSHKGLGKLNGFFHASPQALANASPNSPLGRLAQAFRDALSAYAGNTTGDPTAPSTADLGAILARATNKPVTPAQVQAIAARLAAVNPDNAALSGFADTADPSALQGIADAANAARKHAPEQPDTTGDDQQQAL
jgi:hypothetical protein